jgi:D-aminopeptidase
MSPRIDIAALATALDGLPKRHPGPGGVAGVVQDGQIIATRAWGYADLDTGQPMTRATRLPICSISKQFTCQVLLAAVPDPARLDPKVAALLPQFTGPLPSLRQLCDNQSGLRDYWALTVLHGARAEQTFPRAEALPLLARMKTGHFPPGTAYSYCNGNFRLVSELIEAETGTALEDLYRKHIWEPAGMKTALLTADTRHPADRVIGYEGSATTGFFPARNGIFWIGDAGISAALDDMLAYEAWIDATRDDDTSLYRRISAPPSFADGRPAAYGYGLAHHRIAGQDFTGHGGALRGFRAQRLNARAARLSVVVMFNHEGDAFGAAQSLIEAALGHGAAAPAPIPEGWDGQWLAADGLLVQIEAGRRTVTLRYATGGETVTLAADGTLTAPGVVLRRAGGALTMTRAGDNTAPALVALPPLDSADVGEIAGRYRADELGAELVIEGRDGAAYARFEGMLGRGRMERMAPAGRDVWVVTTRRSMDAPAPGDWTLIVRRGRAGTVSGLTLGCWLARGVDYTRLG